MIPHAIFLLIWEIDKPYPFGICKPFSNRPSNSFVMLILVEQELLTLPEHLSSSPVFNGVRVTRSLVLYVCFVDRCLSFCTFSFGHCVVCSSSIYGFWFPLWYLQTLLNIYKWTTYSDIIFKSLTPCMMIHLVSASIIHTLITLVL